MCGFCHKVCRNKLGAARPCRCKIISTLHFCVPKTGYTISVSAVSIAQPSLLLTLSSFCRVSCKQYFWQPLCSHWNVNSLQVTLISFELFSFALCLSSLNPLSDNACALGRPLVGCMRSGAGRQTCCDVREVPRTGRLFCMARQSGKVLPAQSPQQYCPPCTTCPQQYCQDQLSSWIKSDEWSGFYVTSVVGDTFRIGIFLRKRGHIRKIVLNAYNFV